MAKFAENRRLYGCNSRPKRVGVTPVHEVLNIVGQNTGHFLTIHKSPLKEAGNTIIPVAPVTRKLTRIEDMLSPEELVMYRELCALADMA